MILASWNAIPKKKLSELLKGPAKVYDGAFDYDRVASDFFTTGLVNSSQPYSYLFALKINNISATQILLTNQLSGLDKGFWVFVSDKIRLYTGIDRFNSIIVASTDFLKLGKNIIVLTYDGSNNASGITITVNGVTGSTIVKDTLTSSFNYLAEGLAIGSALTNRLHLNADIKQLEIINRVATAQEIADASDPITGGSFRASGIAHNSGQYLLALNTDQTDGNPPTTFPDTPQYTITSFGGAQYVPYESL